MAKAVEHNEPKIHLRGYVIGFLLSLALTMMAFMLVNNHVTSQHETFSHAVLVPVLALLAVMQFVVQSVFFLHVATERRPRWRLLAFLFMLLVVLILVVGSIWIMQNLNYNMMGPDETRVYMRDHEGF